MPENRTKPNHFADGHKCFQLKPVFTEHISQINTCNNEIGIRIKYINAISNAVFSC